MEHEGNGETNCNWWAWNTPQRIDKGNRRLRNQMTDRSHPKYSIKIGQNTEESPGDLKRFCVTQTPVRNHQLSLV